MATVSDPVVAGVPVILASELGVGNVSFLADGATDPAGFLVGGEIGTEPDAEAIALAGATFAADEGMRSMGANSARLFSSDALSAIGSAASGRKRDEVARAESGPGGASLGFLVAGGRPTRMPDGDTFMEQMEPLAEGQPDVGNDRIRIKVNITNAVEIVRRLQELNGGAVNRLGYRLNDWASAPTNYLIDAMRVMRRFDYPLLRLTGMNRLTFGNGTFVDVRGARSSSCDEPVWLEYTLPAERTAFTPSRKDFRDVWRQALRAHIATRDDGTWRRHYIMTSRPSIKRISADLRVMASYLGLAMVNGVLSVDDKKGAMHYLDEVLRPERDVPRRGLELLKGVKKVEIAADAKWDGNFSISIYLQREDGRQLVLKGTPVLGMIPFGDRGGKMMGVEKVLWRAIDGDRQIQEPRFVDFVEAFFITKSNDFGQAPVVPPVSAQPPTHVS